MEKLLFANNAESTAVGSGGVVGGILSLGGTSLNLTSGGGSSFPSPGFGEAFFLTIFEKPAGTEENIEVVKVTSRTADNLTIVRNIEGATYGYPTVAGRTVYVAHRLTALTVDQFLQSDQNLSDLDNAATARTNLGLGDSATKNVGPGATNVAAGDHTHTGVYEPADATILKDADIGSTVQAYDAATVKGPASATDSSLARFDGITGKLLKDGAVIGVDVQAYDAQLAALAGMSAGQAIYAATYTPTEGGFGFRNKIINGGCQVAQRGSQAIVLNDWVFAVDRIHVAPGGFSGATGTASKLTTTSTVTGSAASATLTTTGTGSVYFRTRLESRDTKVLNGKTLTLSAKIYQDTGSPLTAKVRLYKANSEDTFSATTQIGSEINLGSVSSGAFTNISTTFTLGATDGDTGLQLTVYFESVGAVSSKVFALGDIQLEEGSVATPFETRPYGVELALCQRYYWKPVTYWADFITYNLGGSGCGYSLFFPQPMRATPTISNVSQSITNGTFTTLNAISPTCAILRYTVSSTGNAQITIQTADVSIEL